MTKIYIYHYLKSESCSLFGSLQISNSPHWATIIPMIDYTTPLNSCRRYYFPYNLFLSVHLRPCKPSSAEGRSLLCVLKSWISLHRISMTACLWKSVSLLRATQGILLWSAPRDPNSFCKTDHQTEGDGERVNGGWEVKSGVALSKWQNRREERRCKGLLHYLTSCQLT